MHGKHVCMQEHLDSSNSEVHVCQSEWHNIHDLFTVVSCETKRTHGHRPCFLVAIANSGLC